jgi:hypothetical protein
MFFFLRAIKIFRANKLIRKPFAHMADFGSVVAELYAAVCDAERAGGPCATAPNPSSMAVNGAALSAFYGSIASASARDATAVSIEALWAALRAQAPAPPAQLGLLLVDRIRLGCVASARAYLQWIAVPGAGAFDVLHPSIFKAALEALSPLRHSALVDVAGAPLSATALDSTLSAAFQDLQAALESEAAIVHLKEADLAAAAHAVGSNLAASSGAAAPSASKPKPKRRRQRVAQPSRPRGRPLRKRRAASQASYAEEGEASDDASDGDEASDDNLTPAPLLGATLPLREQLIATARALLRIDNGCAPGTALAFLLRLLPTILMTARVPASSAAQRGAAPPGSSHKAAKRAREATIAVVAALIADTATAAECGSATDAAPALHSAALSMLRRICLQVPSRAEGRNLAMGAVTTLLFALPRASVHAFVGFVAKLARATKVAQRMGAVLLVERMLAVALSGGAPTLWRAPASGRAPASCAPLLLAALWDRVRDKAPNVRCVALRSLTNMLRKLNRAGAADTDAFSGALGCRVVSAALGVTSWAAADAGAAAGASTTTVSFAGTSIEAPRALGRVLIARLADAKSSVRRAALSAFLAALECVESEEQDERLPALLRLFAVNAARSATAAARCLMVVMRKVAQLCADETLSVRKIAIQALAFTLRLWCGGASARDSRSAISPLVASAVAAQLRALWVKQGLPLLGDGEASVRHACASTVAALLVAPIAESSHDAAATAAAAATTSTTEATNAWALLGTVAADASTKSSVSAAMRLLYSGNVVGCDAPDVVALLTVLMVTVERSLGAAEAARAAGTTEAAVKRKVACERLERGAWALLLELVKCCATEELAIVPTLVTFFLDVWRSVDQRECSFIYRYILHESCSQFDSLPLTYLTV